MSEESTGWNLPSVSVTLMSTMGFPLDHAVGHRLDDALLDRRDELLRDRAAEDLALVDEAFAPGEWLDVDHADGVLAVTTALLDVPAGGGGLVRIVSRKAIFAGLVTTSTPNLPLSRSIITSRWASPIPCITVSCVSSLRLTRKVGSSSRSRASPVASLSSSPLALGAIA